MAIAKRTDPEGAARGRGLFMHLSIATYPTWGMDGANMGDMSLKPGPMGRARWGICQDCALTRKVKN